MTDTLGTLLRLRHLAADQAKRNLAAALSTERDAQAREAAAASIIRSETAAAPCDAAHPLAGAYAVWLPRAKAALAASTMAASRATEAVTDCRAALAQSRADERAVEHVREMRRDEIDKLAKRKQQAALDEVRK